MVHLAITIEYSLCLCIVSIDIRQGWVDYVTLNSQVIGLHVLCLPWCSIYICHLALLLDYAELKCLLLEVWHRDIITHAALDSALPLDHVVLRLFNHSF